MANAGTKPPSRAEHVGSLPRPERLLEAREAYRAGKLAGPALAALEDECIREAVAMQERVGIGAITDGEFRKTGWREFLFEKCDGFAKEPGEAAFDFTTFEGTKWAAQGEPKCVAPLKRRAPLSADDFAALKAMTRRPIKANLPTPSIAHFRGDVSFDHKVYPDRQAFFAALTAIMREEIADLARRGCTYLQMDEVPMAVLCDPRNQQRVRERGENPDGLIDTYIDAINQSIKERPAGMTVAVHLCRGNLGHGMADGGYEPVADRMFNLLHVDGFFLEYDTPRAGDFAPLRFLPKGKVAVLGLVSTKQPEVESADGLKRRIDEAATRAPIEQLALSPQCGFSSVARAGRFAPDLVERKLARIVEVAADIWGA
ncbi:MAG TPA: 5-methyltetrahydropteroyltriglutamate--homocysteine S-methyltransferase [Stellaceae bacterium]|nr:5-methyltetrahydropteroyltriglutamate--homocysteine S-methyltransferase [Stellaceae bacterium]